MSENIEYDSFQYEGIMATTLTNAKSVGGGKEYYNLVYDVTTARV